MRFTVDPAWDLEVDEGVTLGECREQLAALTGVPSDAPLTASGVPLQDSQVAGVAPWVAGSALGVAGGQQTAATSAPVGGWHVGVVAGPDAGAVGRPSDHRVLVGRAAAGPGALTLRDPAVSRRHAVIRRVGRWWVVRRAGRGRITRVRGRRRRRLAWGFVRPTDRLLVGTTALAVRAPSAAPGTPTEDAAAPHPATAHAGLVALVVPLAVGLTLAALTRSPVYLLLAVAGPAATGLPLLVARLRRRRPPRPDLGPEADLCRSAPARLPPWWQLATEGLVVLGPDAAVGATGRALVGAALLAPEVHLALVVGRRRLGDWAWCRWLEQRLGGVADAAVSSGDGAAPVLRGTPLLAVLDEPGSRIALERWWLRRSGSADAVLALARSTAEVPPWCRWTLTVDPGGTGVLAGPERSWAVPVPMGGVAWAEDHARWLASRDAAARVPSARAGADGPAPTTELPAAVSLAAVGLPTDVAGVRAQWAAGGAGPPTVPLGIGAGGVVEVDLAADGPHALVAGTTGSGKSELLQAFVLALALRHPPERLAMVLLDFKGGTGVGRCGTLPHVVGSVSDLDPAEAGRALDGLRAELRRREAALAAAGVADAADLPDLPRLLVVVDEFQALTEDLPDFVPGLVRLAAQGRSLGFHLVLATQRPGGAVSPQMRANLALRICLRVTEAGDSIDVVDVPAAALLPRDRPGRAVLRRGAGPVEVFQAPWAALPTAAVPVVRRAPDWTAFGAARTGRGGGVADGAGAAHDPATDRTERLAAVVRAAAGSRAAVGARLWAPPLPLEVRRAQLPPTGRHGVGAGRRSPTFALGLTDPTGGQAHGVLTWPARGLLAVAGARGSGRSTVVATVVQAALAAGWEAHVVGATGQLTADLGGADAATGRARSPGLGTVVGADDPRRIVRLLALLTSRPARPSLLAVDDVATVVRALEAVPRGRGGDLLDGVVRDGPHHGLAIVVAGEPRDVLRWAPRASHRLVLAVPDAADDVLLGVPRELVGGRRPPGRGVWVEHHGGVRCQLARPDAEWPAAAPEAGPPLRLAPIPLVAEARTLPVRGPGGPWSVPLGIGGDDAGPVTVDVAGGLLVVGPDGTGRSTALATVLQGLLDRGLRACVLATDGPLAELAGEPLGRHPGLVGWTAGTPATAAALAERCAREVRDVLVVDDADRLGRADPALDETLAGWVLHRATGGRDRPVIVAAARTDQAAAAYRGLCAALRGTTTVVLGPLEPGSGDVAGTDVAAAADPVRPRHPGRGVVVRAGRPTPVQVTAW